MAPVRTAGGSSLALTEGMPAAVRLAALVALAASLVCCTREIEAPDPFPTDPRDPAAQRGERGGEAEGDLEATPSRRSIPARTGPGDSLSQGVDGGVAVDLVDFEPSAPAPPRAPR